MVATDRAQTGDQEGSEGQTQAAEQRDCPYCDSFSYTNTKKGRITYASHIKMQHPDQTEAAKARQATEERLAELFPVARRLDDALRRIIPRGAIETIVNVFNRNSASLSQDRHRFRVLRV
ncbi:MAG: hypothetical protein Q8O40_03240 [Chloroflexota bacterium]|nr:hypothetical protein [Chloroflexota bacterium]